MKSITLVRHGESTGNASGVIQGLGSSPLTPRGLTQASAVADRLRDYRFDRLISSDMERAVQTAAAFDTAFSTNAAWREMDVGGWDGLTNREIREQFAGELLALSRGEDIRLGGTGETVSELGARVSNALRSLLEELGDDGSALVVCHGGVIEAVLGLVIGTDDLHRRVARVSNTGLTTIIDTGKGLRLTRFNDAAHLEARLGWVSEGLREGQVVVDLVRHGRTEANTTGRWQGQTDSGLNEEGRRQALRLAEWFGDPDAVYSSPLGRACETARVLVNGSPTATHPGLVELGMGDWEGLTTEEIEAGWPDSWNRIYRKGEDLPRGTVGETWAEMKDRVGLAISEISGRHPSGRVSVVSHGAAIRGYVSDVLGLAHGARRALRAPANTSVSRVVIEDGRRVLAHYNVAPHLSEDLYHR